MRRLVLAALALAATLTIQHQLNQLWAVVLPAIHRITEGR